MVWNDDLLQVAEPFLWMKSDHVPCPPSRWPTPKFRPLSHAGRIDNNSTVLSEYVWNVKPTPCVVDSHWDWVLKTVKYDDLWEKYNQNIILWILYASPVAIYTDWGTEDLAFQKGYQRWEGTTNAEELPASTFRRRPRAVCYIMTCLYTILK